MMRNLTSFVVFLTVVLGTAVSKPLWSTIINSDIYSTPEINAPYQDTRSSSPYYVYNIYTSVGGIPNTVHVSGKPAVSYLPAYNLLYYGTSIYDLQIPFNPIYPVLTPSHPGMLPPALPPTSTQEPFDDDNDYDGIEKLDTKVDPATETKKPETNEHNDSITVEAI